MPKSQFGSRRVPSVPLTIILACLVGLLGGLAVARHDGVIRPRVSLIKILASGVCIGTVGSVGREGPIVQIGSSLCPTEAN
jgi:H+/Cl- antiporter ClcA